jgi:predicted small secreted protein
MQKLILALCLLTTLAACNTMAGFGRDLEKGGAAIQRNSQ